MTKHDLFFNAWRSFFQHTADWMFIKDINFIYQGASDTFVRMVGCENAEQVIGKTDFDLFGNTEIARRYRDDDLRLLQNGQPMINYIEPLPPENGAARFSSTSKYLICDGQGKVVGMYGVGRDVTRELEQAKESEKLKAYEENIHVALECTSVTVWEYEYATRSILQGEHAISVHGYGSVIRDVPESLVRDGYVHPDSAADFLAMYAKLQNGAPKADGVFRVRRRDDSGYWYEHISYGNVFDENGKPVRAIGLSEDVTAQYELGLAYRREVTYRKTVQQKVLATLLFDVTQDALRNSDVARDIGNEVFSCRNVAQFGARMAALAQSAPAVGRYFSLLSTERLLTRALKHQLTMTFEFLASVVPGEERWIHYDEHLLRDPETGDLMLFVYLTDIDVQKRKEQELVSAARRDSLSGLLNHAATVEEVTRYLAGEGRMGLHALFMVDVDHFKAVNDGLGHQVGDQVIVDVSRTLQRVFRTSDIIGRMGGDEFMLLMKSVSSPQHICRKAHELVQALQFACHTEKNDISISASVGVAVVKDGDRSFDTLYAQADDALYRAKDAGRARYLMHGEGDDFSSGEEPCQHDAASVVQLRSLLESMDGGVMVCHLQPGGAPALDYVSPSFWKARRLSASDQYQKGEIFQKLFSDVPDEDLATLNEAIRRCAHSDDVTECSYRIILADGATGWQQLRMKRMPSDENGHVKLIGVASDVTQWKNAEESLRFAQQRYQTAMSLSKTLLWEVDLQTHTLRQPLETSRVFGHEGEVFPNAPQSLLDTHTIHPDSVPELRRMYADLYAGVEGKQYCIQNKGRNGNYMWTLAHFSLLRREDGTPFYAIGAAEILPNIDGELRRFQREIFFSRIPDLALLSAVHTNLTTGKVEYWRMGNEERANGQPLFALREAYASKLHPDDGDVLERMTPQALIERFREGESWRVEEYRRLTKDGVRWTSCIVNLVRHPVTGDLHAFFYVRDAQTRHRWERTLGEPIRRDVATLLLDSATTRTLVESILSSQTHAKGMAVVTIMEIAGFERLKQNRGMREAGRLLFSIGRLCRMMLDDELVIGHLEETRILVFRPTTESLEEQRARMSAMRLRLRDAMKQLHPCDPIDLVCGFAAEDASVAQYDSLLQKALIACRAASYWAEEPMAMYVENDDALSDAKGEEQTMRLRFQQQANQLLMADYDEITGLYARHSFFRRVRQALNDDPDGKYLLLRMDINHFKLYNDVFGPEAGDQLLRDIADAVRAQAPLGSFCTRLFSDHFALFAKAGSVSPDKACKWTAEWLASYSKSFSLSASIGVYYVEDPSVNISLMCDRALIALRTLKGGYETRYAVFDEQLRDRMLHEQRLMDDMNEALGQEQFVLYFQPQINYETGEVVGAEALVRWQHPQRGLLPPGAFIPLLESNGAISRLDEYVWERACRYMRQWMDRAGGKLAVCVSVNLSRADIYNVHLCEILSSLTSRYGIPNSALRLEITETAYARDEKHLANVVDALQRLGFEVEMDDFGSAYSSLNMLKDITVDAIKLDLRFLSQTGDQERGGNILSSIIRMARWLNLPVIAEGVETREQANYLKSLGCRYMQGYYFDRPMPAERFEQLLSTMQTGVIERYRLSQLENATDFWNASAQNSLLFNSLMSAAAIVEYAHGQAEVVRANDHFYQLLGTTRECYNPFSTALLEHFEGVHRMAFEGMLQRALQSGEETECEVCSSSPAVKGRWTRNRCRLLSKCDDLALFYIALEDITDRKELERQVDFQHYGEALLNVYEEIFELDYQKKTSTLRASRFASPERLDVPMDMNAALDAWLGWLIERRDQESLGQMILNGAAANQAVQTLEYKIRTPIGGKARILSTLIRVNENSCLLCNVQTDGSTTKKKEGCT